MSHQWIITRLLLLLLIFIRLITFYILSSLFSFDIFMSQLGHQCFGDCPGDPEVSAFSFFLRFLQAGYPPSYLDDLSMLVF